MIYFHFIHFFPLLSFLFLPFCTAMLVLVGLLFVTLPYSQPPSVTFLLSSLTVLHLHPQGKLQLQNQEKFYLERVFLVFYKHKRILVSIPIGQERFFLVSSHCCCCCGILDKHQHLLEMRKKSFTLLSYLTSGRKQLLFHSFLYFL